MDSSSTSNTTFFTETKPASIRIWHWFTLLFFAASITTVLLNSTVFKTRNNIGMVIEQVKKDGGVITEKQARNVAHEYSDKLWEIHTFIGYGLAFLMLWRIVAEVTIAKEKKLKTRIQKAMKLSGSLPERNHYLIVQISYAVFYLLFLSMVITGLILAFEDVSWCKAIHRNVKEIHGFIQYLLYAFMSLHIIGVIYADINKYNGIVSRMINGKEQNS